MLPKKACIAATVGPGVDVGIRGETAGIAES
jgi:hypothetical protein